ncbi:MAG: FprA family A-type flavoprotein [Coriobacteriia bacterium]
MQAVQVSDGIVWVGAIDWGLRDFHGYETPNGTTYNAYLVIGEEKTALIDTVKLPFVPELLDRIAEVMPLERIDYIVVNHVEPDHNSGLRAVMEAMPRAKVVASVGGVKGIAGYHGSDLEVSAVGETDTIDLGGKTLQFLPVPMVHWPDSMFTYCAESKTLMPNDAFGQHVATSERFADEIGLDRALEELTIYYANILMPLSKPVSKSVEKVGERGWECTTIAPSHGVIWRGENIKAAMDVYARLTAGETLDKLVIAFTTMWGATETLAAAIADGAGATGCDVRVFDLAKTPVATVTREILDSRALLFGSPTLHHGMLYRSAGYLQYLAGLAPKGKLAGVFGSFGWSGESPKQMAEKLSAIGFEMPMDALTCRYRPKEEDLAAAWAWGKSFGELVMERGRG